MSQSYFNHHFLSNSDFKRMVTRFNPKAEPENLEEIFDLGSLIHAVLLEPARILFHRDGVVALVEGDKTITFPRYKYDTAKQMADTFMKDELCRKLMMWPDFRREHEFYRVNTFGVKPGVRCKADGDSRELSTGLEYKGLSIMTEKAFDEAIMRLDYDQGVAWYLDITRFKQFLMVGVSKKDPKRIFKRLINRDHQYYKSGMVKIENCVKMYSNLVEV